MRANHSPLRFFGLIATASVLASGVYASAALAATTPATTGSNGASASPVLVGASSASDTGTRNLVDGTRAAVDSDRTSQAMRSVTTTTTNGGWLGPASGSRASGSATPGQQLVQAPPPRHRPSPDRQRSPGSPPALTSRSPRSSAAGTRRARAVRSPTTTTTAPTDPSPADSAAGNPRARQLAARPAPASRPAARKPPARQPVAPAPPTRVPNATPPVATAPTATNPVATESVATEPVATQSLKARSAPLSPGNRARTLHQFQTLVTQRLGVEADQVARPVTAPDSPPSSPPSPPSPGLAKGHLGPAPGSPQILAGDTDLERGSASVAAAPRRPEQSPKPPSVARSRAAVAPPTPQALSPAPPVQTRLPVGGAAAATGGGIGSVAPSVVADFEPLALALAAILLARFSLDRAMWRSTLLASRLEHPG